MTTSNNIGIFKAFWEGSQPSSIADQTSTAIHPVAGFIQGQLRGITKVLNDRPKEDLSSSKDRFLVGFNQEAQINPWDTFNSVGRFVSILKGTSGGLGRAFG
jgi:hypothetical protein